MLGEGHWTKVYQGRYDGQLVAVKVASKDEKELKRELGILHGISHHNVVRLHGACHKDGKLIAVLEMCGRGCLESMIKTEQALLQVTRRRSMATDVAAGLAFLHESRVFHSDLKTANILVTEEYACKIADFNMSKRIPEGKQIFHARGGTRLYSSPEVSQGKPATFAADIYSFGLCLFELLTLQSYFDFIKRIGERVLNLVAKGNMQVKLTGWPQDFEMLQETVNECCSSSPDSRPSAREVLVCLQSTVDEEVCPPIKHQLPVPPRHSRPVQCLKRGGSALIIDASHPGFNCVVALQQVCPVSGRWLVTFCRKKDWLPASSLRAVTSGWAVPVRVNQHVRQQACIRQNFWGGGPAVRPAPVPLVEEVRESETEDHMPTIVEEPSDDEQEDSSESTRHDCHTASELSQEHFPEALNSGGEDMDNCVSDDDRHDQTLVFTEFDV